MRGTDRPSYDRLRRYVYAREERLRRGLSRLKGEPEPRECSIVLWKQWECPRCRATVHGAIRHCIYCGEQLE